MSSILDDAGLSRGNLARWKSGVEPKIDTLIKIAEVLGVDASEFLPSNSLAAWEGGKKHGIGQGIDEVFGLGYRISPDEIKLINLYWDLNLNGRKIALERMEELSKIPDYKKVHSQK